MFKIIYCEFDFKKKNNVLRQRLVIRGIAKLRVKKLAYILIPMWEEMYRSVLFDVLRYNMKVYGTVKQQTLI